MALEIMYKGKSLYFRRSNTPRPVISRKKNSAGTPLKQKCLLTKGGERLFLRQPSIKS